MHYLLLFFFLVTTPTPTPTTTATKQCTLQDTVIVTETFEVPADMEPNVHMLQQSIEERIDDFELISIEARKKDATHLSLRFGLRPRRLGMLVFAPGVLSFSDAKQEPQFVPFASLSMECVSKAPVSKLHPPLPLRPEEAIIISPENKKQTQEVGAEDIRRALGLQASHHFFIRSIELLLFSVGVIIVAIWLTIVRGGSLEKKEKLVPRNFFDECHHILESKAPFNQRVMMLSVWTREFFSHLFQKDMVYSTTQEMVPNIEDAVILDEAQRGMCVQYLQELEKAEFSRDHLNEEAWSKVAEQARSIVTLFRTA